jgi:hypothetical protein
MMTLILVESFINSELINDKTKKMLIKYRDKREKSKMKTFQIQTLGCKVNAYESEYYRQTLLNAGYLEGLPKESTDIVVINTCTVTNTASFKSRQKISTS